MKKPHVGNLLIPGSRLCSVIGIVWLAALLCYQFEAATAARVLFLVGAALTLALLGMLIAQLIREDKHKKCLRR